MEYKDNRSILHTMYLSRFFEEKLQEEFGKGNLYGTTHLAIGQEASHVGLAKALEDDDWIVPTHRCHGFNVARGTSLESMFSEMLGSRHGICRGIGGSMHMTDTRTRNLGSSAVVGSGIPLAGGCAYALKRQGRRNIAVAVFGDGASSRGTCHEMMNLASVWSLPLLFFMENNHYGMSAASDRMISTSDIASRAEGYSMAHATLDGNDVFAVMEAVKKARTYILETGKPYFLELDTYRLCGHSKSDKLLYRSREEEEKWKGKDPIQRLASILLSSGETKESLLALEASARSEVEKAWTWAWERRGESLSAPELCSLVTPERGDYEVKETGILHKTTYREAVREAIADILEDPSATLMGEDIGVYGGCFGVTGDLYATYGDQILETPVSEEAFVGLSAGAAMLGERPMVEIMYGDFLTLASDGLVNHAAKAFFMSGGQLRCPMVVRTAIGGGTGHGAQHTQCLENMFLNVPGLKVVAPSDAYSAKALLKAAAKENCPVLFLEHKALYGRDGMAGDKETILPLGRAFVSGKGKDLLVIGYSRALVEARAAFTEEEATFLDLATLKPLDEDTIRTVGSHFRHILLVEDTPLQGSVMESVLRILGGGASTAIVSSLEMPLAFPKRLEEEILPSRGRIREEGLRLLGRNG